MAVSQPERTVAKARWPLVTIGVGLGGFLDGIVLHQVLQWHHFVVEYRSAADFEGLTHNTFWDGIFHLACWVVVLVGVLWLARSGTDVRALGLARCTGLLLIGWGGFNIADEIVFHLLLGAHHIRMVENYQVYDASYTVLGVLLIAVGVLLARAPRGSNDSAKA